MSASRKHDQEVLERRRRSARDYLVYDRALGEWMTTECEVRLLRERDTLTPNGIDMGREVVTATSTPFTRKFHLAISANGVGWGLLGVAVDPKKAKDPMVFSALPKLEAVAEKTLMREARERIGLAAESLRRYAQS